jgi:uncharacterized iron-regulated membrane protein
MLNRILREIVSTVKSTGLYFLSLFRREVRIEARTARYDERLNKLRILTLSELEQELSRAQRAVSTLKMVLSVFGVLILTSLVSGFIVLWKAFANFYMSSSNLNIKDVPVENQELAKVVAIGCVVFGILILAIILYILISLYSQRESDINNYKKIIKEKNESQN